jgi:hypothetical protein
VESEGSVDDVNNGVAGRKGIGRAGVVKMDREKRKGSNCGGHGKRRWVWGGVWLIVVREILWERGVDVSGTFGVNKRVLKCQGCEGRGEDWEDGK